MELDFVKEEIPKITRPGGSGREAEQWENHLAPLKEHPGVGYRVWTYDKRTSAMSRVSNVRDRLTKAVPHENWQLVVRVTPDNPDAFGVYVAYHGVFTPEQMAENARKHQERSERTRKARAKSNGNGETSEDSPSPKERVKAAAAAKAAK